MIRLWGSKTGRLRPSNTTKRHVCGPKPALPPFTIESVSRLTACYLVLPGQKDLQKSDVSGNYAKDANKRPRTGRNWSIVSFLLSPHALDRPENPESRQF